MFLGISSCPFNPTPIPSPKWEGGLVSCFFGGFVTGINEHREFRPPSHLGEGMGVGLNGRSKIPTNLIYTVLII